MSKIRSPGVRIIAGHLRGSRLPVPDRPGLRPTSDRVRETLFNWLAPVLPGARCLDAFAGSGALGFEAASRGAGAVVLLERDPIIARALEEQARRLKATAVQVVHADALIWLRHPSQMAFDVVFLDPPFQTNLLETTVVAVTPWLADPAWVYLESARAQVPALPPDWQLHREGYTREVRYALYRITKMG